MSSLVSLRGHADWYILSNWIQQTTTNPLGNPDLSFYFGQDSVIHQMIHQGVKEVLETVGLDAQYYPSDPQIQVTATASYDSIMNITYIEKFRFSYNYHLTPFINRNILLNLGQASGPGVLINACKKDYQNVPLSNKPVQFIFEIDSKVFIIALGENEIIDRIFQGYQHSIQQSVYQIIEDSGYTYDVMRDNWMNFVKTEMAKPPRPSPDEFKAIPPVEFVQEIVSLENQKKSRPLIQRRQAPWRLS